jgi:hypothetical protein
MYVRANTDREMKKGIRTNVVRTNDVRATIDRTIVPGVSIVRTNGLGQILLGQMV